MPKISKIEKKIQITASIKRVWAALTQPAALGGWMGDPDSIKVTLRVGGRYKFFGGETTGKITHLAKPASLEYTWRQSSWLKEWPDSVVRWELKSKGERTQVRLTHSNFPNKEERDGHDEGWDIYFLKPMKEWLESND